MKRRFLRDFARDDSGAVLIYTAAAAVVMLGFVGLAMDVAFWYAAKRDMQSAADAAAMTAALELGRGATTAEIETRTKEMALANGYSAGEVTINMPPLTGDYIGNANFVEVIVAQPQSGFVSGILHPADMPVQARAVATLAGGPACVIALNPSEDATLHIKGNTDVNLDCGAQANSDSATAVNQTGGSAAMTASNINSSGGHDCPDCSPDPVENMPPMTDPFSYMTAPTIGPCLEPAGSPKAYPASFSGTIPAGNYCGGISVSGADIIFETGVYVLGEIGLRVSGNANLTNEAGGVTFYVPDTATGQGGDVIFMAGTVTADLSAPTTGPYNGILFYVDPGVDPSLGVTLIGGSDMQLTGVIYAPGSDVTYSGNASGANTWTTIISDTVTFTGNSYLASAGFVGFNVPLALSSPSLAE